MTVKRHLRRNFILFFLDGLLFGVAFNMIGTNTVVPDFISRLTDSQTLVGLVSSLYLFSWLLPQLLMAQMLNRSKRTSKAFMWLAVPFRVLMALLALGVAAASPDNATLILVIFLTGYLLFALGDGLVTLVWADMLGSTIPDRWRGVIFSVAQIVAAFAALITREIVRGFLAPGGAPFPQNFAQIFGVASVLFIIAGICLALIAEEETPAATEPGPTLREYIPYLGNVMSTDRDFQKFILTRTLLDLTMMAAPFYVLFGSQVVAKAQNISATTVAGEIVGNSILITTLGGAIGALFMSWFSHRSGSRAVIGIAALGSCLHPLLGLLTFVFGIPAIYGALFALGFVSASSVPGYFDWIITHAPPDRRPIYVGLTNTISAVSHLAPFFGGIILSITNNSYPMLFGITLLMAVAGTVSVLFLSEPRRRHTTVQAQNV